VPVCSMVVSPVTTIRKGADLIKRADRGAESGALCHIAGAAVKVAHCHCKKRHTVAVRLGVIHDSSGDQQERGRLDVMPRP
jgi:hypothetical protein